MGVSVTNRIKEITQPKGGYLNPNKFVVTQLKSINFLFEEENIMPSIVGMVVDYLTRFMLNNKKEEAFKISLLGARLAGKLDEANEYLEGIKANDKTSIINACKLVCFDEVFRNGSKYVPLSVEPDFKTVSNIKEMVTRSLRFFKKYGPITSDGFTFEGGYTPTVSAGDGDFLTVDTLWDFKVSTQEPTKEHTLQLLMYYIMGKHSKKEEFLNIAKIGIFNPRLNKVYQYTLTNSDLELLVIIGNSIICY